MLNLESVLKYILNGIENSDERFSVISDEHVLDNKTGIKLHIYDDWAKVTREDETIATMRDFDIEKEQPVIWQIKRAITPDEVIESNEANYLSDIHERREVLSGYFENPVELESRIVLADQNSELYMG